MPKRTDEQLLIAIAEGIMGWHPDEGIRRSTVPAYTVLPGKAGLRVRYSFFSDNLITSGWNPLRKLNDLGDVLDRLDYTPQRVIEELGIKIPRRKRARKAKE